MPLLDWIALAVLLLSLLIGLVRGLVFELLSLAGWIAAFLLAQWYADDVGAWMLGEPAAPWRYAAGFVAVFLVVVFGVGLVAGVLRRLVVAAGLRPVDRTLGAAFGIARGAVALLVLAVVVNVMSWRQAALWRESQAAKMLDTALQGIKPALPGKLAGYLP